MTRVEAVVQLVIEYPFLSENDVNRILNGAQEEQALIFEAYRLSGLAADVSFWDRLVGIVKACADLASLVIPIIGALQSAYGVVKP